ncbi:MAG: hypothetical protein RLN62_01480 [Rickettsiales bacterium]
MRKYLLILFVAFVASSCGPIYKTKYNYISPTTSSGKMCVNKCTSAKSQCNSACYNTYNACNAQMETRAKNDYEHYLRTQCYDSERTAWYADPNGKKRDNYDMKQTGYTEKTTQRKCHGNKKLRDFRTYECSSQKTNCLAGCRNDYDGCYTNCGGRITSHQECIAFCDKN